MESEGYFSFTHNHRFRGDVGAAEAGDVGLAGVDVNLVLVLVGLTNLAILGDCLLAFLPETLKYNFSDVFAQSLQGQL